MIQSQAKIYEGNELVLDRQAPALTLLETPEEDFQMYRIADLNVAIKGEGKILRKRWKGYYSNQKPAKSDVVISVSEQHTSFVQQNNPYLTYEDCAYICTSAVFNDELFDHQGFILHASAVALNGKAYLFSGDSGAGKSTHASLWLKTFSDAYIINDDKPAIRKINNNFEAYGTPWCGSLNISRNEGCPVQAIVFLEHSQKNRISAIDSKEALYLLFSQSYRTDQKKDLGVLLSLYSDIIQSIPLYKMGCTISEDAVLMAYGKITDNKREGNMCTTK